MKSRILVYLFISTMGTSVPVSADVFNMPSDLTSLEFVTVGNPGNISDSTGYGSVSYTYNVGKFEVTASQYCEFLNAVAKTDTYGLYNWHMGDTATYYGCNIQQRGSSGTYTYDVDPNWANRAVNYTSFWDACRFVNWLHNGQPTGSQNASSTEDGAYALNGYTGSDGGAIARNPGAKWFVPSEDEWYKAAYYDPNKPGDAYYWDYPTHNDSPPIAELPSGGSNSANCHWAVGSTTDVGAYNLSSSYYDTFDQGGNVWEWNETLVTGSARGERGGSFGDDSYFLGATNRGYDRPDLETCFIGFRVAEVPEPATLSLLSLGGLAMLKQRKQYRS